MYLMLKKFHCIRIVDILLDVWLLIILLYFIIWGYDVSTVIIYLPGLKALIRF